MRRTYTVEYALYSTMGKVRMNNEDNFYCDGQLRLNPDSVEDEAFSGKFLTSENRMCAVFDGMGGEACGEVASFVAADNCRVFCENTAEFSEYLIELANILNDRVLEETASRSLVLMGTTCAMIQFYKNEIYILSAGDSRIFKFSKNELRQISKDHTAAGFSGKAPLTKFIGTPDKNGLDPYLAKGAYKVNDIFMLCTDGITDMVDEETITLCLSQKQELSQIAKDLIQKAMDNGGKDNATVILCKIHK